MIKLLIDESPLIVLPSLAERIGLDEAIVLQQVHYLVGMSTKVENSQVYKDGYYWVFNSIDQWQSKYFRWWAVPTVKRIFQSLTESHLLIASAFGGGKSHKRLWYRVNHYLVDELAKLPASDFLLSRNDRIKMIKSIRSYQNESIGLDQNDLMNREVWDQNDLPTIYKNSEIKKEFQEKEEATLALVELSSIKSNSELNAPLITNQQSSDKQITPHEGNFSAANRANATQRSEKIDPFYKTRLKSQDVMWAWLPDGEWVLDGGLNPEFWNWMATSWMSKFNCTIHEAKSNVISHFRKQPEQLVLKWDEYSSQKLKKESFTPLPDAVRDWQQVQHLLTWEQYNNCKDLEHFYSLRSWNRAYLEYALKHLPNFDWSKHLTTISA